MRSLSPDVRLGFRPNGSLISLFVHQEEPGPNRYIVDAVILPRLAMVLLIISSFPPVVVADGRTADFSGYEWLFRRTREPEGPGPNVFLDNPRTIWVDDLGYLHLRVWTRGGRWYCSEARLAESLGYGTYEFVLESEPRFSGPSVILGLFTYDHEAPDADHREINIEFGRFGDPKTPGTQYAMQPFDEPGNQYRFPPPSGDQPSTHGFCWLPGRIESRSAVADLFALSPEDDALLRTFVIDSDQVPLPGSETVHINLWLYRGEAPPSDQEVVVRSFTRRPGE
jgi:hypothetical protein